ncbi:MAG: MerR family transcriptional regulator [Fibrobacterota bacterium]
MLEDKRYYSIGEVAEHFALEPHVLRFWEKEFTLLRPRKNRSGNRMYSGRDVEIIDKIRFLLYEELFTIEGARRKLSKIRQIPLEDYRKTEKMLSDKDFIIELKRLLGAL